ncbi:heparan-alpha-glucosaminide N-acetyltransferase domain-containing protein [Streptomyces iakyrus]|uniref:heparan-alpha-glucosaminide N-acetyltransferase domain-containing protein n=1 Tax=Streptomyces iakyrus TaxID=68219 RepID=UPI0033DB6675
MNALPSTERLQAPAAPLPRIVGLDVARGLAVIGMLAQHFASLPPSPPSLFQPGSWVGLVSGGSTILFAVIGGISIGIITGAARRLDGQQLLRARMKLLARAAVIFLLGAVLNAISPGVGVILCVYALCYIAVIPLLRVRPRTLALGAVAGMVVVPVALAYLAAFKQWRLPVNASFEEFDLLFAPNGLSVAPLTLYFLLGIALSRFDISSVRTVLGMLVGGVVLVVVGYGGGWAVTEGAGAGTAAVPPAPAGGPATAPPDNAALTRGCSVCRSPARSRA